MNKLRWFILGLLIVFISISVFYNESRCFADSPDLYGDCTPRLAAHKCNKISKLTVVIDYGIKDFEVDVHVQSVNDSLCLMIGHEAETATGQTFEEYMTALISLQPDFNYLWLDMKDLKNTENEMITIESLNKLDSVYCLKKRVLIESRYIPFLDSLAEDGWAVSFYSDWQSLEGKSPEEQDIICDDWLQSMQEYDVDGISFDAKVYEVMNDYFEDKKVNNRIIKQYSWDRSISFSDSNRKLEEQLQKYTNLTVLLISFSDIGVFFRVKWNKVCRDKYIYPIFNILILFISFYLIHYGSYIGKAHSKFLFYKMIIRIASYLPVRAFISIEKTFPHILQCPQDIHNNYRCVCP